MADKRLDTAETELWSLFSHCDLKIDGINPSEDVAVEDSDSFSDLALEEIVSHCDLQIDGINPSEDVAVEDSDSFSDLALEDIEVNNEVNKHSDTDHTRNTHEKQIKDVSKCEFCDYVAKKTCYLRSHLSSVHSDINFPCDLCNFKGSCKRYLTQHVRINHTTYQCDLCVFVAKKPNSMKAHLASEHKIIQESHLCDQCSFVALSADALAKHVADHNPFAFSCTLCDYKTKNNRNLQKHIKDKHTNKNKLLCDECDFTTSANYNLVRHKERVHQGLSFPCEYCGYVAPYRDKINDHIKSYHGDQKHECNQCGFVGKNPRALKNHISADHFGIRYQCPYCGHEAKRRGDLQDHVKKAHKMEPLENSYFQSHEILKKTLEIGNTNVPYIGIIQNAEITQDQKPYFHKQRNEVKVEHTSGKTLLVEEHSALQNSLPHILETNASELPITTEEEPDVLNTSNIQEQDNAGVIDHADSFTSLLEQEMKVEHSDDDVDETIRENPETVVKETKRKLNAVKVEIFKCDICQKILSRKDKLTTHKLIHKGEKPFTCEECGNKLLTSVSLKQHLKTHQEGFVRPKSHQCSLCGKSFESSKRLTEHQFSHTGEKAYQCTTCGVKYAVIESLNKHMKKHTEENPFPFSRKGVEVMLGKEEANLF